MARTRSQQQSAGPFVSLDDLPRPTRATRSRSASIPAAESQKSQVAGHAPARKVGKTRGRKKAPSTRGRKKSVQQKANPEIEQQDIDSTSPNPGESVANNDSAGQPFEPATNSFEQSTSVLPSIEMNDLDDPEVPENSTNCELPSVLPRNSPIRSALSRSPSVGIAPARRFAQHSPCGFTPPGSPPAPGFPSALSRSPSVGIAPARRFAQHSPCGFTPPGSPSAPVSSSPESSPEPAARDTGPYHPSGFLYLVLQHPHCASARRQVEIWDAQKAAAKAARKAARKAGKAGVKIPSPSPSIHEDPPVIHPWGPEYTMGCPLCAHGCCGPHNSHLDKLLMFNRKKPAPKWGIMNRINKTLRGQPQPHDALSPSKSSSSRNRVSKSVRTTPIRRTRSSYAAISERRRAEASGRINRTLYRLPELLSQNANDEGLSITANPTTPLRAQHDTPPMTAPAAGTIHPSYDSFDTGNMSAAGKDPATAAEATQTTTPASPGIVRWVFNTISQRWTNIRDRYASHQPTEMQTLTAQNLDFTPTPTPPQHLPTSPQTEARPARRRLPFTRTARSSSLFPSGLDPELKARCYERLLEPTTANDQDIPSEKRKREVSPESMLNQDQNVPEKRKREVSPDYIPNPKGSSYGMDDDFFTYTEEEYAEEEKRQAEEAKHKAEEAENAQAGAPSAKKARVNAPQWPRRRTAKNRPEKGNTSNPPPSKQPGFEKNSRRTYAPPDLETILSSRLFDEDDINLPAGSDSPTTSIQNQRPAEAVADPKNAHSDSNSAPPGECSVLDPSSTPSFSCPETTDRHTQGRVFVPNPHGTFETPYSSDSETEEPTDANYANEAAEAVADPNIAHSDSNSAPPGECSVLDPSSTLSLPCPETTDRHTQGRVFVPNPLGTFETPYSSDSETEEPTYADYANEASDLNRQDIQAQSLDSQNVTSTPNTNSTLLETPHSSFPAHNGPGAPPLISGTATTHIESSTISALLSPPRVSGEDDLLPPYPVQRKTVLQRERSDTTVNRLTDTEAPMPFTSDPLDELPDVIVKFNPGGTQADEMTVAAVSDSDDASPLTRARSKAEQFKPKTPSRLREAHRFSSSMTQISPFTPNNTSNTDFEHPETENHPGFRNLEDMMADCDADWLYGQCPSGDLRQLKWPKKISLTEQIRSHGIDSADEDIAIVDAAWNDPAQFQRDLEAMRAVLATSMNKPFGSPIDWSSWDSRLQQ